VLTCSTNITATATSSNGAVVFYNSTASGGCSPPPSLSCNPPSGSTFPIGTTTVTCTASDTCGQSTNCSFTVKVVRPPLVLACSTNLTVGATSSNGAVVFYTSTASGGCPPVTLVCNPPSGSTFPIGTVVVTCTASDTCGSTTNCSFLITVTNTVVKRVFVTNSVPPVNAQYISPAQWHALYAGGIYVSNVIHRGFTQSFPPPPSGQTNVHSFGSTVNFMFSTDGGHTFQPASASATATVGMGSVGSQGSDQVYQTEMLQLDLSGGTMPPAMRLRESPSKVSTGQTRISQDSAGYHISSFFDVFTELSMDSGGTWSASDTAGHMEMHIDPAIPPTTLVQPRLQAGHLTVTVQSVLGVRYILEFKTSLTDPAWTTINTTPGNGQVITITDPASGATRRFYHVRVEEDPNQ